MEPLQAKSFTLSSITRATCKGNQFVLGLTRPNIQVEVYRGRNWHDQDVSEGWRARAQAPDTLQPASNTGLTLRLSSVRQCGLGSLLPGLLPALTHTGCDRGRHGRSAFTIPEHPPMPSTVAARVRVRRQQTAEARHVRTPLCSAFRYCARSWWRYASGAAEPLGLLVQCRIRTARRLSNVPVF